jgi:hypothetical protein
MPTHSENALAVINDWSHPSGQIVSKAVVAVVGNGSALADETARVAASFFDHRLPERSTVRRSVLKDNIFGVGGRLWSTKDRVALR